MSRPGVNESLKWDFIKIVLTKDQERNERDKERMWVRKSKYIKLDRTYCCIGKFNVTFNLCGFLGVTLYFSEGFLETAIRESVSAAALWPLEVTMVYFLGQKFNLWSPTPQ